MGKYKDEYGKTRVGAFLEKIGRSDIVDRVIEAGGKAVNGNYIGAMKTLITKDDKLTLEQKTEAIKQLKIDESQLKAFELEIKDRQGGRELYKIDSVVQKVFGIVFLLGYIGLSWFLLNKMMGKIELTPEANTLVTMIWTGTSMKLNTIIDFFFGGSLKQD